MAGGRSGSTGGGVRAQDRGGRTEEDRRRAAHPPREQAGSRPGLLEPAVMHRPRQNIPECPHEGPPLLGHCSLLPIPLFLSHHRLHTQLPEACAALC